MATTVLTAFSLFKTRLEATAIQTITASQRHQAVRRHLNDAFAVDHSLLIGSYIRDTACRPLKDIDLMVILNKAQYEITYRRRQGPYALLTDVKRALATAYPKTRIRIDGQAVTMRFSEFTLDVVPAFAIRDVEEGDLVLPDSPGNSWIRTNPKKHRRLMIEANKRSGDMLKPLVKMAKAWNRNNGDILNGFHIEVMVYRILEAMHNSLFRSVPKRLDTGIYQIFTDAQYLLRRTPFSRGIYDPVAPVRIDTYLTDERRRIVRKKLSDAEMQARKAIRETRQETTRPPSVPGGFYSAIRSLAGDNDDIIRYHAIL